jgi:ribosomal protein S18 acetylase RimI-like enzyme
VTGHHALGPHVVGQRVVVRRLLRDQRGPTGGPAFADVLGTCLSWADGSCVVAVEGGTPLAIALADIVSGKPVPPRASRFSRLSAEAVEHRAAAMFRPDLAVGLGDWVLRLSGGVNRRPSSMLAVGDPGMPLDDALEEAFRFYAGHDAVPCAQVVVGSAVQEQLEARGWSRLDAEESDTDVMLAGIAALSRRLGDQDTSAVQHADTLSRDWLVGNDRALASYDAVARNLDLPDAVFASLCEEGRQVARARVNLVDDWALLADLTVRPDRRRSGLARTLTADLAHWAAEHGASTMLLQVQSDNEPALALYASLGFERHHTYRYLRG